MAIEDEKYGEVIAAVNAFAATGRARFVESKLLGLARDIFKNYGYDLVEVPAADGVTPQAVCPSAFRVPEQGS